MIKLKRVEINNWITYKNKTELKFKSGITVIKGRNLDRKDKNSSNGAGKSVIASIFPQMIFNESPLPMKSKKTPKEGFEKDTYHLIEFLDGVGNNHTVKKYFKGTTRLQITKNGKDLKFKDNSLKDSSEAKFYLQKLIPINEEQFYSLYYFDIKRSSILQYGTDAQRHKFIENLFQLDIYDKIAADIKLDWDKSKLIVQELEILDRQLSTKSDSLVGDPEKLKKQHLKLLEKTDALRTKVADLMNERQQCQTFILLSKDINDKISLLTIKDKLSEYALKIKNFRKDYSDALANNEKIKSNESIIQRRDIINKELNTLFFVEIDKSIQDTLAKDQLLLDKIEDDTLNNKNLNKSINKLKENITEIDIILNELSDVAVLSHKFTLTKIEKNKIREQMLLADLKSNLEDTLHHLNKHKEQNCPVCATILDKQTLKQIVKQKEINIEKSKIKYTTLSKMLEYKTNFIKKEKTESSIKELESEIKKVENASNIEKRIEENQKLLQKMRRKILLKAKLSELPDIKQGMIIDTAPLQKYIQNLEEKIEKLSSQKNKIEQLNKLNLPFESVSNAKEKSREVDSALVQYQPLLDKVQSKLNVVSVDSVRAESVSKDINELSVKINNLKISAPDFKVQTVLRKAFGPRGIRKQRVAEIGAALESTLNKYASQVFDFKITFEFIITDTKFQILANRNNKISDVRRLSGAESRYFNLLLMITLLKYTPKSKRLDIVFLDEAEASLDKAFRDRFVSNFLPLLQEVVSCVVLITPQEDLFVPKSLQYIAIKQGGVSTLDKVIGIR